MYLPEGILLSGEVVERKGDREGWERRAVEELSPRTC